jgi:hypothetical protein
VERLGGGNEGLNVVVSAQAIVNTPEPHRGRDLAGSGDVTTVGSIQKKSERVLRARGKRNKKMPTRLCKLKGRKSPCSSTQLFKYCSSDVGQVSTIHYTV